MSSAAYASKPVSRRTTTRTVASSRTADDLDRALVLAARVVRDGCRLRIRGRSLRIDGDLPGALRDEMKAHLETLRGILVGPRKTWATGWLEAVLVHAPGPPSELVVLLLSERRLSGDLFLLDGSAPDVGRRLARALSGTTGLIVPRCTFEERAHIGRLLAAAEHPPSRVVEVDFRHRADYRDLLAGSSWLRARPRGPKDDPIERALLAALQVRSLRKGSLPERKSGWLLAATVRVMHEAQAAPVSQIATDLGLSEAAVNRLLCGKKIKTSSRATGSPGRKPNRPSPSQEQACVATIKPATPKQLGRIRALVQHTPCLAALLSGVADPRSLVGLSRADASRFIGRAERLLETRPAQIHRLSKATALRAALAAGHDLAAAAKACGLDQAQAQALLVRDLKQDCRREADAWSALLDLKISLPPPTAAA